MSLRVIFTTNFNQSSQFVLTLFPGPTPLTVQNFLGYVNGTNPGGGTYDNTFFHRALPGAVAQAGGYKVDGEDLKVIPTGPQVPNEFDASGLHNTLGTIGMAHVGSDINTQTDQFFFNTKDNSADFDPGKYTVFGEVTFGLDVLQAISHLPIVNVGSPLNMLPVQNWTPPNDVTISNFVIITDVTLLGGTGNDFNADGKADILFSQNGAVFASNYEWQLNDRAISGQGAIDLYDKAFTVQVIGDFNGDGRSDVAFENPNTGGVWAWLLDGTTILSQGAVDVGDSSYHLLGSADLNGDGKDDLIWRNDAGSIYDWQMNGKASTPLPVQSLDPSWHVVGAGDFNGDAKDDLLLRNISNTSDNGAFYLWEMDGNTIKAQGGIERPGTDWQTLGTGDFNGDGKVDFAVRHVSNFQPGELPGAVWVYLMDGITIKSQGAAGVADASQFHVAGIGDLNGDGKDDILYRNDAGYFYSWDMNGTAIGSEGAVPWADPALSVVTQHWDLV